MERLAALECVDALLTLDDDDDDAGDAGKENKNGDDGDDDGFTFRTGDGGEGDDAMVENDDAPVFSGGGQTSVSFFPESNGSDDDAREKYEETVGLLRAQTAALKRAHGVTVALEAELAGEKARAEALERDARERMREVRREMETLRVTLKEVVESARAASEGKVCEKARADALEGELRRAREEHRRDIESASAELALVRASANASNASRSGRDDGSEAAVEKLKASEAKAKKDAQRAREALMEQKKTSEALEKRLRETRSRADLAEAKCRELKTTQKRWERLEATGDAVFLKSPASSATPGTLRESHREVRAYAARRVEKLEREASDTRRESGVAAANLDARLAAESVARGAAQGSLESARSRIRVLEGECEALRTKAREAAQEVADLNMALKLAEERAAQAEETSAKEIAAVMDRVRETERVPVNGGGGVYTPASTSAKTNEASLLARAERAESRARDAEEQLQSLRRAARSASQRAVDALSPASSERKTRSRTEPLRRAEEPESLPPRTPTTASNGRRANSQSNRARAAANELLSSLRHKLEASSPSGARRIARRVDDASDRSDDEYEEIDPAYMTPRRGG